MCCQRIVPPKDILNTQLFANLLYGFVGVLILYDTRASYNTKSPDTGQTGGYLFCESI